MKNRFKILKSFDCQVSNKSERPVKEFAKCQGLHTYLHSKPSGVNQLRVKCVQLVIDPDRDGRH
jgi:hypothetical protein